MANTTEMTVSTLTEQALTEQLDTLNTLARDGKDVTEILALLTANVKAYNVALRNAYAASLVVVGDIRATMVAYIKSQHYGVLRVTRDKDTMQWSLKDATARLSYPQFCSTTCTDKESLISAKGNWQRYLECFCDNIAVQAVKGGHIARMTKKGGTFTSPIELLAFKKTIGFDKDEISNKELMRELETVFAAVLPVDMTNCDGEALTPVKADVKFMVHEFIKTQSSARYIGFKESSTAAMERALFAAIEKRYLKEAYPLQAAANDKPAKKTVTEKEVAKENAGAPDLTTTPAAGDVKVVAGAEKTEETKKPEKVEKKTARKASAEKPAETPAA